MKETLATRFRRNATPSHGVKPTHSSAQHAAAIDTVAAVSLQRLRLSLFWIYGVCGAMRLVQTLMLSELALCWSLRIRFDKLPPLFRTRPAKFLELSYLAGRTPCSRALDGLPDSKCWSTHNLWWLDAHIVSASTIRTTPAVICFPAQAADAAQSEARFPRLTTRRIAALHRHGVQNEYSAHGT
jgi:hypothetical protein